MITTEVITVTKTHIHRYGIIKTIIINNNNNNDNNNNYNAYFILPQDHDFRATLVTYAGVKTKISEVKTFTLTQNFLKNMPVKEM